MEQRATRQPDTSAGTVPDSTGSIPAPGQPEQTSSPQRPRPTRLILAAVIAVEVLAAGIALWRAAYQPIPSYADEVYHLDYALHVAHGVLPVIGRTYVYPQALALGEHRYPGPPAVAPDRAGWAGESYEAQQPPLYYLIAAPVSALTDDWAGKVYALRWLAVGFVVAGGLLLVPLGRVVAPRMPPLAVAGGLLPLTLPDVAWYLVKVSNDAPLIPLSIGFACSLVLAVRRASVRWLWTASMLAVAAVLTKLTAVGLLALLAGGTAVVCWRRGTVRSGAAPLLAAAAPLLAVVPWLAWNWRHFHASTGTAVLDRLIAPTIGPHPPYTLWGELSRLPMVVAGWTADEPVSALAFGGPARVAGLLLLAVPAVFAVAAVRRRPIVLVAALPLLFVMATLIQGTVSTQVPVWSEGARLTSAWLPLFLVTPAAAIGI